GTEIDDDRDHEQQPKGHTQQKLPHHLPATQPILLPKLDERGLFLRQHSYSPLSHKVRCKLPKLFIFSSPQKSVGLKLPQLLSQFLYQTKRLDLPGIGTFPLDASAVLPQESDRSSQTPATGIQFANANIAAADDILVTFIK